MANGLALKEATRSSRSSATIPEDTGPEWFALAAAGEDFREPPPPRLSASARYFFTRTSTKQN